jgi:hypothetical protein
VCLFRSPKVPHNHERESRELILAHGDIEYKTVLEFKIYLSVAPDVSQRSENLEEDQNSENERTNVYSIPSKRERTKQER